MDARLENESGRKSTAEASLPPPGACTVGYRSGHFLKIETTSTMFSVSMYTTRPSIQPLVALLNPPTEYRILRGAVEELSSEEYFTVTLEEREVA